MPTFPTRIVRPVSGDIGDPRANHSVRPASGHPVRNEPAKTRRAALDATAPATPTTRRLSRYRNERKPMPTVTVGQENSVDIEIHYFGHGLPGLIHDVRL